MLCPVPVVRPPWSPALISVTQQAAVLGIAFGARLGINRENPVLLHCTVLTTCPEPKGGQRELRVAGSSSAFETAKRTRTGSGPFLPEPGTKLSTPIAPHSFAPSALCSDPAGLLGSLRGFKDLEPLGRRCCLWVGCVSANSGCSAKPCSFPCNCYG